MRISHLVRYQGRIVAGLIIPLLLWCVDASAFAAVPRQDVFKASFKTVEVKPDHMVIVYELLAPADDSYEVSFVLLKEGSPSFRIPVSSASGDVGEGKFAGSSRQVRWDYLKDCPANMGGDGFYFEITVSKASRSNLLYYLGVGALAVIGGGVAILGGKKEATTATSTPTALPVPPSRPSQ